MKNIYVASLIAGIALAIAAQVFYMLGGLIGLYQLMPADPTGMITIIIIDIIWGIILGVIYSKLYGCIPKKGAMKGLVYGLLIWLVSNIRMGSLLVAVHMGGLFTPLNWPGFWALAVFGLVLGALYKK